MSESLWDRMRRVTAERDSLRRRVAELEAELAAAVLPGVVERVTEALAGLDYEVYDRTDNDDHTFQAEVIDWFDAHEAVTE